MAYDNEKAIVPGPPIVEYGTLKTNPKPLQSQLLKFPTGASTASPYVSSGRNLDRLPFNVGHNPVPNRDVYPAPPNAYGAFTPSQNAPLAKARYQPKVARPPLIPDVPFNNLRNRVPGGYKPVVINDHPMPNPYYLAIPPHSDKDWTG